MLYVKKRKMPELNQLYNFNSLYIVWIILLYNIFTSSYYEYVISKIIMLNHTSLIVIFINITGIYLFLKNVTFEINVKISYM
jgi:hypothetical protein